MFSLLLRFAGRLLAIIAAEIAFDFLFGNGVTRRRRKKGGPPTRRNGDSP